jgi:hypothetical protein
MWPDLLERYEAIFILDDDLSFSASAISRLFEIRTKYDLWLIQPAFDPRGKISHPITRIHPTTFFRYTNFVEVTCPLFRKDKLDYFMQVYDPSLVGWGINWWYMDVLGPDLNGKVAVVDAITCLNPYDYTKGGCREIDKLQSTVERVATWKRIRAQHNIRSQGHGTVEYGALRRCAPSAVLCILRWSYPMILGMIKKAVVRGVPRLKAKLRTKVAVHDI